MCARDLAARARDDGDRREFLEAVDDEVERARGGDVGEDRVERLLDAEQLHRGEEEHDVEDQDDVADLEQVAALADQQRGDLRAVEDRAAADGEADARADEEPAEDRRQHQVVGDVGIVHRRENQRQPADGRRTAQGEGRPICR